MSGQVAIERKNRNLNGEQLIYIFCDNKYKIGTDAKYCLKQHFLRAMYQDFENQPEPELSSVFLYFFRSVNVPGGSSRGPAGVTSQ